VHFPIFSVIVSTGFFSELSEGVGVEKVPGKKRKIEEKLNFLDFTINGHPVLNLA